MVTNMVSGKPLFVGEATIEGKGYGCPDGDCWVLAVDRRGRQGRSEEKAESWATSNMHSNTGQRTRYSSLHGPNEKISGQPPE